MERVLHSSLRILERISALASTDIRKRLVCDPNCVAALYVGNDDIIGLSQSDNIPVRTIVRDYFNAFPLTKEEHLLLEEGLCENKELTQIHLLDNLCEMFGDQRFLYHKRLNPEVLKNSVVIQENHTKDFALRNKGIEVCDLTSDKQLTELSAHWSDPTDPDEEDAFSWSAFLCHPLPPSSSAVIVDRYVFTEKGYKRSAHNIINLLNTVIPKDYEGRYFVTIIFEYNQLGDKINSALNEINKIIRWHLSGRLADKRLKLNIDYIAVRQPRDCPKTEAWVNLHNLTHDRYIFTNYYLISASGSLSVSDKESRATRWQKIHYDAILSGIDNPYQNYKSIPLFEEKRYFYKLFNYIKAAPSNAYQCYHFNLKEKMVTECTEDDIQNDLISFRTYTR